MSDPKTRLNLYCQAKWQSPAVYTPFNSGYDKPNWNVVVTLPDHRRFQASTSAAKVGVAERDAALVALRALVSSGELTDPLAVDLLQSTQNTSSSSSSSSSSSTQEISTTTTTSSSTSSSSSNASVQTTNAAHAPMMTSSLLANTTQFNAEAERTAPTNHHHVLAKTLDVFRNALVRPLQAELIRSLGDANWLAIIKADKSVSETVRSRIDKTMTLWDAMAVCCVAIWLLRRTQRLEKLKLLRAVTDRVRHPIAHFNAAANRALIDWTTCKVLVRNTIEILDWWNLNFACQVERSFIRQLNDIAIAGQAALIQPPIISRTEVALGQLIAGGGQSSVYAAVFRDEDVAVKQFSGAALSSSLAAEQKIRNELQTMFWLNHPHIVRVHGACAPTVASSSWWIVMERLPTSLAAVLLAGAQRPIALSTRLRWAREVASAMRYCHATKPTVLHLDLKSANIVISEARDNGGGEDMRFAKIIDFGTARILESSASSAAMHITSLHVTELWAAPELLQHSRASTHADVYSFGVVLWELLQATGQPPYGSESRRLTKPMLIQEIMANNIRLSLPDSSASRDAPSSVVDLLVACTAFVPEQRPSFLNIHQTLLAATAQEAFVFVFTNPSRFLIEYFREKFGEFGYALPYGPDQDVIAESATIRCREKSLLVLKPEDKFASRRDAERNRDYLLESLPDDDEEINESEHSLFGVCTVEPWAKFAFL